MVEFPIAVTVIKIGNHYVVDPTLLEESILNARLTVATLGDGTICALQKGGDSPINDVDIGKMVELGVNKSLQIRSQIGL